MKSRRTEIIHVNWHPGNHTSAPGGDPLIDLTTPPEYTARSFEESMSATQQHASPPAVSKTRTLPELRKHPQLYEINLWPWLDRLSLETKQQVTIGSIPDSELDKLKDLGFDLVYMMGIWTRSRVGRGLSRSLPHLFPDYDAALPGWTMQDVVGSPFSIQAYEPDPHLGTWTDLAGLRDRLHERGMRLILDFVPNHTGPDHAWVRENPEFYIQGTLESFKRAPQDFYVSELDDGRVNFIACGRDPNFAPWQDTVQLNYFNPRLRRALVSELCTISQFCDGVRCDMAMLLLNDTFGQTWQRQLQNWQRPQREFWQEAIDSLPGFIWMAEAYSNTEWLLQQLGFQFTYDKCFYDRLRDNAVHELRLHLTADENYQRRSVRFLENHDEPRSQAVFANRLAAAAVLMGTVPGMHFYHEGQLEGRKRRIPVQLARAADEPVDERVRGIYERILRISNGLAFHEGVWSQLNPQPTGDGSHGNIISYTWQSKKQNWLIAVNLGSGTSTARIPLPTQMLASSRIQLRDELDEQDYLRDVAEIKQKGLFVLLGAYGAHMFEVRGA